MTNRVISLAAVKSLRQAWLDVTSDDPDAGSFARVTEANAAAKTAVVTVAKPPVNLQSKSKLPDETWTAFRKRQARIERA